MDNTNSKLPEQVTKLEKLVANLAARMQRAEAENKRLKSLVIRADQKIGALTQQLQRGRP